MVQMLTFGLVSPLISPHFRHADGFSPSTSRESISKSVSGSRALDPFLEIPSPLDHGYHVTEAGKLKPLCFEGDVIPMVPVDILEENGNGEEITDEIHNADDYDEDENDEYGDN